MLKYSLGLTVSLGSYVHFLATWVSFNILLPQCPTAVKLCFKLNLFLFLSFHDGEPLWPLWCLNGRALLQFRAAGGPAPIR